jgi:hypothetical protein
MPVQSFIKHFRDEFAYHIEHKKCLVPVDVQRAGSGFYGTAGYEMMEIEIDGKKLRSAGRQHGHGCRRPGRRLHSALLLSQEALDRGQLPHVPGAGREGAQAAAGLCDPGHQRHEGARIPTRRSRPRRA